MKKSILLSVLFLAISTSFAAVDDGSGSPSESRSEYCSSYIKAVSDGSGSKAVDDGSGSKAVDDGSGNKAVSDGSGSKAVDDGSGLYVQYLACLNSSK